MCCHKEREGKSWNCLMDLLWVRKQKGQWDLGQLLLQWERGNVGTKFIRITNLCPSQWSGFN